MPFIPQGPRLPSAKSYGNLIGGAVVGASGAPTRAATGGPGVNRYTQPQRRAIRYRIYGVTKDSAGAALGACTVHVYEVISAVATKEEPKGRLVGSTMSDANGNYTIDVYSSVGVTFQVEAYKAGAPDVAGISVNTLVGAAEAGSLVG